MSKTYEQLEPVISALDERIKTGLSAFPTDTAEGSIVSFPDGADGIPLKSLVVNIDPVQSGSGDPSPDNVRPISGWTGMTVNTCGKNLLNPNYSAYQTGYSYLFMNDIVPEGQTARFTFIDKDTSVDVSNMSIGFQNGVDLKHTAPTTYSWAVRSEVIQSNVTNVTSGVTCSGVFIYPKTEAALNAIFSRWDIMVELGSTATPYEPYNGQTIPIDWQTEAGTVYGGHLDVLSGVLTVDRAGVDMGTLDWSYQAGADGKIGRFKTENLASTISRKQTVVGRPVNTDLLSSIYSANSDPVYGRTIDFTICSTNSDGAVYASDSRYTVNAAYKEAMDGVMLVYRLATPIEIQLTPHDVKTLSGQNNIWADTGDSAVEYRADTKMYIERLTEPDADMIADANITSGSYFMVGNTLYKATANIASGSAVIEGTNATRKSLSEALNEINQ